MFNNQLLRTKGIPAITPKPPKVPSIQPVERKEANIEAEKGETILNSKGELGKFLGKKHSKTSNAGTPALVEPGSFIFSDKLKLPKEYIATILDKEPSKVSKMTPAELSLKFPTKQYLDTLSDENADSRAKNTADIMLRKNLQSLQVIFEAQQMLKEDSGIQEGTLMANGGYLPKAADGFAYPNYLSNLIKGIKPPTYNIDPKYSNIIDNNKDYQNTMNWLNQSSSNPYIFQSSSAFNKFMSDSENIVSNPKGQLSKSSPLVQEQYQGQNFYNNGTYDLTPQGKFARLTQFEDYYTNKSSVGESPNKTYNFFSPILLNEKTKEAIIPKNAKVDPYYLGDLKKKGFNISDESKIANKSREQLLMEGYDGRTIYNKSKTPIGNRKGDLYSAMFDPSNTRENNDAILNIKDPRYRVNDYVIDPLRKLPSEVISEQTPKIIDPITKDSTQSLAINNPTENVKSNTTTIRDYVTEEANRRKGQLYSRMFDQDRLPYLPSYNQAVPYQRATPISYAPALAGLRSVSEQMNNSNVSDQIKGATFSDYLSKAQEQLGKIDMQNQANNAQVSGQNFNNFVTAINQNQQTNNQYKQQYDQLVQNQEQARTLRKYTLQDAIAELNARKAEKDFNYELINVDPTSNYSVNQSSRGLRNYIDFNWKERNRLNPVDSAFFNGNNIRAEYQKALNSGDLNKAKEIREGYLAFNKKK